MKKVSTVEYFWSKIDIKSPEECWEAHGVCFHKHGYPQIRWGRKTWTCRKLAYHLTFPNVIIVGLLRQQCHNKLCCNPYHMYDSRTTDGERTCENCGIKKSMNEFNWAIKDKRKDTICKECSIITQTNYLADPGNRKKYNEQRRKRRLLIKDKLNEIARNDPKRKERQAQWDAVNIQKKMYYAAKSRARKKNIPFDITPEDILIPDKCSVLHIPLYRGKEKGGAHNFHSPSLDRIIPSLGYVKGNIRVISLRANVLKNNASVEELKLILMDAEKNQSTLIVFPSERPRIK